MKTAVRDSSLEVYHSREFREQMNAKEKLVMEYVRRVGRCTRAMIARDVFGNRTGSASGRVNALLYDFADPPLREELSLFPCPISGKRVHWVYPAQRGEQLRLM